MVFHGNQIQQFQRRLVLVGLGVHRNLIEHQLRFVGVRGQQMNPRNLVTLSATKGLSVQRHRRPTHRRSPRHPATDRTLEGPTIHGGKQIVQRRATGGNVAGEPQRHRERLAPIPTELRDGVQTPRPGQNRHRRQRQNRRQRVTTTLGTPRIRNLPKCLKQRNRLRHVLVLLDQKHYRPTQTGKLKDPAGSGRGFQFAPTLGGDARRALAGKLPGSTRSRQNPRIERLWVAAVSISADRATFGRAAKSKGRQGSLESRTSATRAAEPIETPP